MMLIQFLVGLTVVAALTFIISVIIAAWENGLALAISIIVLLIGCYGIGGIVINALGGV